MKPSSLATLIIRLTAIYTVFHGLVTSFVPALLTVAFRQNSPSMPALPGRLPLYAPGPFDGLFGIQFAFAIFAVVLGVLLFTWSAALGRLIARGLD